jgi:hypothetical protein
LFLSFRPWRRDGRYSIAGFGVATRGAARHDAGGPVIRRPCSSDEDARIAVPADSRQQAPSRRQRVEQYLGLFQVERVEAFGEPAVDGREQIAGRVALALIAPQPRHAHRGA